MAWRAEWSKNPIWNDREYRPRTAVRFFYAPISLAVGLIVGGLILQTFEVIHGVLSLRLHQSFILAMLARVGQQVLGSLTIAGSLIVGAWFFGRRRISDLGFQWRRRWVEDFLFGVVLGLGLHTGALLVGIAVGWISVTGMFTGAAGRAFGPWLVFLFIFHLCTGVREEVIFRGFLLTNLAEAFTGIEHFDQSLAAWTAVGISSVGFSLWHTGEPVYFLVLAGLIGVMFGTAYVLTGSIALPIGFHTTWNMAVVGLYGPRSLSTSDLVETSVASPIVAGMPLAELLNFIVVGVGMLCILGWVRVRDGDLRARPEISIPNLHHRRFERTLGWLFEPDSRK